MKSKFKKILRRNKPNSPLKPDTSSGIVAESSPPAPSNLSREIGTTLLLLATAVVIALFTKAYVLQPYIVDGQSMQTTLQDGDRLLVDKLPRTFARLRNHAYIPKRGSIVIFNQNGLPGFSGPKQLIKRVIGLPGERVVVNDGQIRIYNAAHPGGFNPDQTQIYHIKSNSTPGQVDLTLTSGQLFVCGDNRSNSEDSRYFGPIQANQIVGKLSFRILPLSKIHHF